MKGQVEAHVQEVHYHAQPGVIYEMPKGMYLGLERHRNYIGGLEKANTLC